MLLEILTPDAKVFEGDADRVVLPGILGGFEILKDHAPLISALTDGIIKVGNGGTVQEFQVKSGFVEVLNNRCTVCVEGFTDPNAKK